MFGSPPGSRLSCRLFFNSALGATPAPDCGEQVDVSADLSAAHQLLRLGVSPHSDLPAMLLSEPGGKLRVMGLRLSDEEARSLAAGRGLGASRLVVYGSSWCPDCRRAKRVLDEAQAKFEEVDIDLDPAAETEVIARSGGRRVVPTLRFDDRVWAFNPDPPLLRRLLESPSS